MKTSEYLEDWADEVEDRPHYKGGLGLWMHPGGPACMVGSELAMRRDKLRLDSGVALLRVAADNPWTLEVVLEHAERGRRPPQGGQDRPASGRGSRPRVET